MTRIRNQERLIEQATPKFGRESVIKSLQKTLEDSTTIVDSVNRGSNGTASGNGHHHHHHHNNNATILSHTPVVPVIVDSIVAAVSRDSNDGNTKSKDNNGTDDDDGRNSKPNNDRMDSNNNKTHVGTTTIAFDSVTGGGEATSDTITTVNDDNPTTNGGVYKNPIMVDNGKAEEEKIKDRSLTTSTNQQQEQTRQHQHQHQKQKIVLLSGHTGLSMKKLCDMAYNNSHDNNYGESRSSCWYIWTKVVPISTTSTPNKARRRVIRSSFEVSRYSIYGSTNYQHYQIYFSEIAKGLSQIVTQINSLGDDESNRVFHANQHGTTTAATTRDAVVKKLRTKLTVMDILHLIQFCPEIEQLFLYNEREINLAKKQERFKNATGLLLRKGKGRNMKNLNPTERLIQLVRLFLQAVGGIKTIVWAFEDIQFGMVEHDPNPNGRAFVSSSFSMLEQILNPSDDEVHDSINIILIGTIRKDKIKKGDPNLKQLQTWVANFDDVLHLSLKNMTKDNIASMLQAVLRTDQVDDLAELFYHRTNGNDYFVLQLLDYLEQEELLTFSTWTYQWQWDIDEIKRQSMVADNVLSSIGKRFSGLSRPVQRALQCASHIGYRFDEDLLDKVLRSKFVRRAKEMKGYAGGKTHELLKVALDGNFIERIDADDYEKRYKFVHVQVQTACRQYFERKASKKALQKLHWNVGLALWRGWKQNETYEYVPNRVIFPCVSIEKCCEKATFIDRTPNLACSFFSYLIFDFRLKK